MPHKPCKYYQGSHDVRHSLGLLLSATSLRKTHKNVTGINSYWSVRNQQASGYLLGITMFSITVLIPTCAGYDCIGLSLSESRYEPFNTSKISTFGYNAYVCVKKLGRRVGSPAKRQRCYQQMQLVPTQWQYPPKEFHQCMPI